MKRHTICALITAGCFAAPSISAASENPMEDRLRACTACHLSDSAPLEHYAPPISGKPVEYLYQQLHNYRDGRRLNKTMQAMLANLDSAYLHDIASYFSALPVSTSAAQKLQPADRSDTQQLGQALVLQKRADQPACTECHGKQLQGDQRAIPSLQGLSAAYISAQLGAWKNGTRRARKPDCMAEIVQSLDGKQISVIASWLATNARHTAPSANTQKNTKELPIPCGAVQ